MAALKELKNNSAINLKKADKGTTTVIMNKSNKIQEAKVQLENREHYKPLEALMVNIAQTKVNQIIDKLRCDSRKPQKENAPTKTGVNIKRPFSWRSLFPHSRHVMFSRRLSCYLSKNC